MRCFGSCMLLFVSVSRVPFTHPVGSEPCHNNHVSKMPSMNVARGGLHSHTVYDSCVGARIGFKCSDLTRGCPAAQHTALVLRLAPGAALLACCHIAATCLACCKGEAGLTMQRTRVFERAIATSLKRALGSYALQGLCWSVLL